ncbi:MAG TPA: HAMP domain-containing sensor histidine kinase [Vicinamibacterales bacterium]|jgi:signal transduction histidine kinase|nr:HAMP domain-containing sensor histidine kinase [Vicinamibacterales bacterium]
MLTPQAIFHWFAPPEFSHPDIRHRARALWIASWPFFAVVTVVLGIAVLVEPDTLTRRAVTIAAVGALITGLHTISRAGRPTLASWILVIGLSLLVTQRAWITGGIYAPVPVFYAFFIVMGGVLLGRRGGVATAAVCFIGAIVLTVGTSLELLATQPGAGSPLGAFVFVTLGIGLALVCQELVLANFSHGSEWLGRDAVPMLVHDMRSPIQVLLAHLELLRKDIRGESVDDVEAAIEGATILHRLTNDLLDISRLEAGRMPVRRSVNDLSVLAYSVVTAVRVLQRTRDIAVETLGDSTCSCDPELTRRIIENLVSNAMKHTPIKGRVRVVVSGSRSSASIAIHDEGPGVPLEKRTRIFEPYSAERLRSVTGYESSGLGLAFCKLAVEAQGGAIRIEDGTPRGSIFVVELPR